MSSDPGAINEALADYFAAINCGVADFGKDAYNRKPMRSIDNDRTCQTYNGEVHNGI